MCYGMTERENIEHLKLEEYASETQGVPEQFILLAMITVGTAILTVLSLVSLVLLINPATGGNFRAHDDHVLQEEWSFRDFSDSDEDFSARDLVELRSGGTRGHRGMIRRTVNLSATIRISILRQGRLLVVVLEETVIIVASLGRITRNHLQMIRWWRVHYCALGGSWGQHGQGPYSRGMVSRYQETSYTNTVFATE